MDEWTNPWCIWTTEYYSALKKESCTCYSMDRMRAHHAEKYTGHRKTNAT